MPFWIVIFQAIQNIVFSSSVWSNYRPAGHMWPATAFSVARGIIQEKSSYLKFVEKRVRLHLSHWIGCAGQSAFAQEQWIAFYLFCVPFCFILLFCDQFRRYGPPLTLRCGIWLNNLCVFSVPRRSLSWRIHLAQRTKYQQINLSIYPRNAAISKWPASQINWPSLQWVILVGTRQA